jgi:hypothetical protein
VGTERRFAFAGLVERHGFPHNPNVDEDPRRVNLSWKEPDASLS